MPKYRLGHPENYLFLLSKNILVGLKYPKINWFNFLILKRKNFTAGNGATREVFLQTITAPWDGWAGLQRRRQFAPLSAPWCKLNVHSLLASSAFAQPVFHDVSRAIVFECMPVTRWMCLLPFESVAVLAEISLRSPRKIFIFTIKKTFIGSKYPKNKYI